MRRSGSAGRRLRYGALMLLAIAVVGPLFLGCAGRKVAPPGATYDSPGTALRELAASAVEGTITATARIEIFSHGQRYPLKAAMMTRYPVDLRLESIPLLGPPDFFLSIEGDELRAFLPEKGAFYSGSATRRNISRFLYLPLSAAEIVGILMGRLPAEWDGSNDLRGERDEEYYRVDRYEAGEKLGSVWIDPVGDLLVRLRAFTGLDEAAYTAEFTDHARVGNGFLPHRLTVSADGVSLSLRYTDVDLLHDHGASFGLPIPEGITPIPLEAK
jgi:hypothetical protein